jgi:hypothetical protein
VAERKKLFSIEDATKDLGNDWFQEMTLVGGVFRAFFIGGFSPKTALKIDENYWGQRPDFIVVKKPKTKL